MRHPFLTLTVFCISLSTSLFAQKNNDAIDIHEFEKVYELEKLLKPIDINGQIFQVHAWATDGEHIFVLNDKEVPPVKSYRLSDGQFTGGFTSKGGGPGEFQMFNRSGFGIRKGQLIVQGRKYVRLFDIQKSNDKVSLEVSKEFRVPSEAGIINSGFMLDENTLAASIMFSPKDFVTFNIREGNNNSNEEMGDFGDYPDLYPDFPTTAKHHLYTGLSDYSEDGHFLIKAYGNFPLLRLFDLENNTFSDIEFRGKNEQISKVIPDKNDRSVGNGLDLYRYQGRVKIGGDYIVTQYEENLYKKVAMTSRGNLEAIPQADPLLLVFNLDGKLLAKLSLPDWFQKFTLTPDDRMIVFHPEIENKLFVADLKQFK
ncbi:BF3164 family lipoprotein [Roseivirga misakiensis]|nr:BF3164 family lipoprotein [Roseivirga misakiensis]